MLRIDGRSLEWEEQWSNDRRASPSFPGWWSWLALLIFVLCILALARTDSLIEWLINRKMISEAASLTLPG
jgi:hypothetical protein